MHTAVVLDQGAGDQRMTIQTLRQRRHAHAVVDAELQRLHALPHVLVVVLPMFGVGVGRETAAAGERVVDVATTIVGHQRLVFG